MQTAYAFFKQYAAPGYWPGTETPEQGKRRGARALARAEKQAVGYSFQWAIDPDCVSSDWIDDNGDGGKNCDPWCTWSCVMRDPKGVVVQGLWGIDLGRDGEPCSDLYRRVVEAELALEHLGE